MRRVMLVILSAVVLAGCASSKERSAGKSPPSARAGSKPPKSKPIITPDLQLMGKVVSANQELRFVVLDFPLGEMPRVDQRLSVYRQGQKVGELKVSGPQNDTNIVADITAGNAQVGDEVRQE